MEEEEKRYILADQNEDGTEDNGTTNRTSLPLASFNFINSIVGSGIIGMAYAMQQAGILVGLILLVVMGIITDYSLILLNKCSQITGANSYQGVMNAAFGSSGYVIISFLQFVYPFIAMVSYNVLVGDTITKVVVYYADLDPSSVWARREMIIALTTVLLTLPLSLFDGMAKFAKVSFISLVVTAFVFLAIFIRLFTFGPSIPQTKDAWDLAHSGVAQAIAIASFAFMCHHSTFLIQGSIRDPSPQRWAKLTHFSVGIALIVEILFAVVGYATFFGHVQGDLLENYCRDDHLMNVARLLFCLTILLTGPIECFVARDIIINSLLTRTKYHEHQPTTEMTPQRFVVTALLVSITCIVSFSTDCLGIVLEFNGVFAAVPLAYILPAACYIRLEAGSWKSAKKLPAVLMGTFSVCIVIIGLVMIIVNWEVNSTCSHGVEMSYCRSDNSAVRTI